MNKLISTLTALCLLVSVTGADMAYGLALSGSNPENAADPVSFIPFNLGKVIESKTFENSRYTVINIQDLHCHIEAQRNIERIIDRLQKNYKISAVFIEGGYDEVDPGIFGRVKDEKLRNNIIEGLFEKGRLTGAEYYYLKNDVKTPFYGLEDKSVHQANLDRLSKALANNKKYNEKLSEIKAEIEYLKAKYFSRENQRFTETFENYKNGKISVERYYALLRKYIEKLNKNDAKYNSLLSVSRDKYPVFREYCELMNAGKRIDYNKAAVEMQSLVSYLKDNLSYNEYNKLSLATAGFSNIEELGLRLPALSRKYGVNINPGSSLGELISYIQASAKINPVAMLGEERRIAEDIRMAFCSSEEEVEISFLSDFYIYLESFLNTKITAADYDFFEKEYPRFEKIYSKYAFKNTLSELKEDIDFLIRYYGVNKDRNSIFLKNIEKRLSKNEQINELVIVITGGFHSEGLNKIFAENAISYISVMPSVTRETKTAEESYNTFLAAGNNLFSAQTLALTLASQTHKAEIARMMISVAAEELSGLAYNRENIFFIIESVAEALGENIDVDFSLEQTVLTVPGGFKIRLKNADGKIANGTEVNEEILNDNTVRLAASEGLELRLFEVIESLDHAVVGVFNPRVSDIVANITAFAAKRNLITGDGLIFDIETNRSLPEKLGKYDLGTLRKMPDFLQRAVLKAYERDENINNEERIQTRVFLAAFSALGLDKAVLDAAYAGALKQITENADESETFILDSLNGSAVERFDLPYFKEDVTYIADALLEGKIAAFTIEEHPLEDLDDYFERAHKNINFFAIKMIKELFNKNNVSSETFFDESGAIDAVYEILKNAYVHGNKTRGERRIYIAFDKTSNRIIIVNGVFEESSEDKERISQARGALHGMHLGKQIAVSKGDYKAEILSAPNGQEFYFVHFTANPLEMNEDYLKAFGVDAGLFKKLLIDLRNTDEEVFQKVLGVLAYIVTDNFGYMYKSNSFDESEIDEFFQKHDGFFKRITAERVEKNASSDNSEETDNIKRLVMALRDAASTRNGELNEELPSILERLGYDTQNGALELDFSKRIAGALRLKGGFFKEILRGVLVGVIEFVPSAFLLPFFPLPFVLMHYSDGNGLVTLISGYDGQRDESFYSRMRGAKIINYGTWSLALSAVMAVSFFGLPVIWAALVPVVYNVFAHAFYNISHSDAKLQIGSGSGRQLSLFDYENDSAGKKEDVSGKEYAEDETEEAFIVFVEEGVRFDGTHYYFATYSDDRIDEIDEAEYNDYISRTARAARQVEIKSAAAQAQAVEAERAEKLKKEWKEARKEVMRAAYKTVGLPINGTIEIPLPNGEKIIFRKFFRHGFGDNSGVCCVEKISSSGKTVRTAEELFYRGKHDIKGEKGFDGKKFAAKAMRLAFDGGAKLELPDTAAQAGKLGPGKIKRAFFVARKEFVSSLLAGFVDMHYGKEGPTEEEKSSEEYKLRTKGALFIKAASFAGFAFAVAVPALLFTAPLAVPLAALLAPALTYASNISAHAAYNIAQPEAKLENQSASNSEYIESILLEKFNLRRCLNLDFGYLMPSAIGEVIERVDDEIADKIKKGEPALIAIKGTGSSASSLSDGLFGIIAVQEQIVRSFLFKIAGYSYDRDEAFREIFRNALIHGNSADPSKKIWIYYDGENNFGVINEDGSAEAWSLELSARISESKYFGRGSGSLRAKKEFNAKFAKANIGDAGIFIVDNIIDAEKKSSSDKILSAIDADAEWQDFGEITATDKVYRLPEISEGMKVFFSGWRGSDESFPLVFITKKDGKFQIANISGGFVNLENERFAIREENGFYYLVTEHILEAGYSLDIPDDGYNKVISLKTFDPSLKDEPLFKRVETDGEENPETAQKRFLEFLYSQDGSRYLYIDDKESGDKYDAYFENVKKLDASLGGNINGIAVKNRFLFKGKNIAEVEYPGGERFLFYRQIGSDNSKEQGRWYPLIGISGQRGFKNRYVKFWFIEKSAERSLRKPGGLSVEEFYQSETLNNTSQFLSGNIIPYEIIMPKAQKGSKKLTLPALRPVSSFLELLGISGRARETALAVIELPLAALAAYSPVFNETFIKWHRSKTAEQVRARQRGMAKIRAAMDDAWEASAQKVANNFPVIRHIQRPAFAIAGMFSANIKAHVEYNLANSSAKRDLEKSLIDAPGAQEESVLRRSDAKLELNSTKKIIDKLRLTGKKRAVFAAVYEYFKTLRSPESFVNMHYPFVSEKIKNTREYKDRLKGARQIAAATIAGFVLGAAAAFGMCGLGIPLAYAVVAAVLPQFIFNISAHARHNLKNPAAKLMISGESGAERSGISRADLFAMHKKLKIWDNRDIIRYLTEADRPEVSAVNDLFEKETSRFMPEDGQPSGYKRVLAAYKRQLADNRDRKFAESFYSEDESGGESSGYQQLKRRLDASDSGIGIENRDGTYYIVFAENRGEVSLDTVVDIVFNGDRQAHRTQQEAQETKDGEYLNYDFKKVLFLNDQQRIQALEWVIISLDASMREKSLLLPAERRVAVFKEFIAADQKNFTEKEKEEIEWQSRIEHVLHYISKGLITENAQGRYCESPIRFFSSEKYRQRDLLLEIDRLVRNDPDAVLFIKGYMNAESGNVRPSFDMTAAVDIDTVLSGFKISDALEDVIVRKTSSSEGNKYICVGVSDGGLAVYVYETSGQIVNAFYIGDDAVPENADAGKKTVKKPRIRGIIPAVEKEKEKAAVLRFLFVSEMEKCKIKIERHIRDGENEKIGAVINEMRRTVSNSTFKKAFLDKEFLVLVKYYRNFVSGIKSGRQINAVDEAVEIALESASLYFGGPALEKNQKYAQTLLGEEAGSSVTDEDIKEEIYKKSLEKMIRKIKRTLDSEFQNGGEKVKMAVEYAVQHIVDEDTLERLSSGERGDLNFKKEFVSVIVSALNVEPAGMQEGAFVSVVTDIADLQKKILGKIKKIEDMDRKTFRETANEIKADIRATKKYDLKNVMYHIERLAAVRIAEKMEIRGYKLRNKLKDIIDAAHINEVAYETSLLPAVTTVNVVPVTLTLAETRKEIEKRGYSGFKAYLYTGYAELIKLLFMPAKNFAALHDNFNTFEYEKRVSRTRIVKSVVFALSAAASCFVFLIMPPAAGLLPFIANSVVALFSAAFSLAFFGISVHAAHNFFENLAFKAEPMAFSLLSNKEMDGKLDDYLHSADINLGDDVNYITDVKKRKEIGLLFKKPRLFKNGHETRLKVLKLIEAYFLKAIESNDIKAQDALVDMVYGIYDNALDSMVLEEALIFGFEKNGNTDIDRKKYELLEHFYKINAAFFKNVPDDQMIAYRVNNQKRIMRLFLSADKKARMQEIDKEFNNGIQDGLYINANLEILSSIPREYILRRLTQQQLRDLESALQSAGNIKYLLDDLSLFAIPKHISWMYIKTYSDKTVLKRIVSGDFTIENKLHALLSLCAAEPNPFGAEAVFSKIAGAKEEKIKFSGDTENKLAGKSAKLVKDFSENDFYSEKDDYARSLEAEMLFTAQALILHEKYPQIDLGEFLQQLKFTFVSNGKIGFIIKRAETDEAEYYDVAISNKAGAVVKKIKNIVEDVYKKQDKVKAVSKGPMSLIKTVSGKTFSAIFMLFISLSVVLPFVSAEAYSATFATVYPHVEHIDTIVNTIIPVIPAGITLKSGVQMDAGVMESFADKLLRVAAFTAGFFALIFIFFSSSAADFINKHKRKTIKADKVNINYTFTQNRIKEKDLEPFKANGPRKEISVRLYVTNKMPFQKEKFDFKNTGVKINGKSVWISFAAKAPVIFAEDARLEDIEEALKNDNKKIRQALAEYIKRTDGVSLKGNLSLDWINVNAGAEKSSLFYDENGRVRVNISRDQARRPDGVSDYMTGVRQVRDADIFAAVQNIYYFLDNVKTARDLDAVLSDFQKIGNGQIVLDYAVLKDNLTDLKIKDFFAAARANGVKIIADLRAKDASARYGVYRDAGFDGILYESGAGKLCVYDFILASERSASVVSNYENSRQLARELSKSNDIKILNNSEITAKIASDDRSMIDRIRILKILKGSALLGVLKKDRYTPDFVRNAAYAFSRESMSAFEKIDPGEFARLLHEGDTDAVKKYLNLPDSHAAMIYLEKNIYDNIDDKNEAAKAQTAFLEGILEKILISKAVAGSIVSKDLEKMLGKALRMQAQSAKKAQSPVDADSFKEEIRRQTAQQTASMKSKAAGEVFSRRLQSALSEKVKSLAEDAFAENDAVALAGIIELIPAIAEVRLDVGIDKDNLARFDVKQLRSLLTAA